MIAASADNLNSAPDHHPVLLIGHPSLCPSCVRRIVYQRMTFRSQYVPYLQVLPRAVDQPPSIPYARALLAQDTSSLERL